MNKLAYRASMIIFRVDEGARYVPPIRSLALGCGCVGVGVGVGVCMCVCVCSCVSVFTSNRSL